MVALDRLAIEMIRATALGGKIEKSGQALVLVRFRYPEDRVRVAIGSMGGYEWRPSLKMFAHEVTGAKVLLTYVSKTQSTMATLLQP